MAVCANCGAELPPRFRFCGTCGTPLPTTSEHEVRKLVTVLFCDLADSTAFGEQVDSELVRRVLRRYFAVLERVIVEHGGLVEKFIGDAVMAVFGLPVAHEDDALRAVKAAAEIRMRLPELASESGFELVFRTGINSGEVVAGSGHTLATGDAVNVAARLEQAASPGEILLGVETVRLLGNAVETELLPPLEVRGKTAPIEAHVFRALAMSSEETHSPFVGRERELTLLKDAFRRVVEERELQLVTLLGPAGIGKSRLACEFVESLGNQADVARGRCLSYGQALTYWPLVEALRPFGEDARPALEQLVAGGATSPQQLAWRVQQALDGASQRQPLLLLLEDLHWAEAGLLDLLDRVCELSHGAAILVLCVARPELLERRTNWGGGKLNATSLLLTPLSQEHSQSLLRYLQCPTAAEERALALGAGNPLFLEELSAFLAEAGKKGELPPRIQAVLQARLDLLPEPQRLLLATAAVEGTVFHRGALETLLSTQLQSELSNDLAALTRTLLIRPAPPEVENEEAFRFRHQLIRDTAYGLLPKAERGRLHRRLADWLECHSAKRAELAEIGAYHLEQAALAARALAAVEPALEARAATALAAAAERARLRTDLGAASSLWRRALALLDDRDPTVPELQLELASALTPLGEFEEAQHLLEQAEQRTSEASLLAAIRLARLQVRMWCDPAGIPAAIRQECARAIPLFEQRGQQRWLARAWHLRGWAEWLELQVEAASGALAQTATHARLAGDRALEMLTLSQRLVLRTGSRISYTAGAEEAERLALRFPGEPLIYVRQLAVFAAYHAGRVDEARVLADEALAAMRSAGYSIYAASCASVIGQYELLAGYPDEAERLIVGAMRELQQQAERGFLSGAELYLADVRIAQRRYLDALELADQAERDAGPDDRVALLKENTVRALARIGLGEIGEAKSAAEEAVAVAETTDALFLQGHAYRALAETLAAAEDFGEALAAAETADRLYSAVGHLLGKKRVLALAAEIRGAMAGATAPVRAAEADARGHRSLLQPNA